MPHLVMLGYPPEATSGLGVQLESQPIQFREEVEQRWETKKVSSLTLGEAKS